MFKIVPNSVTSLNVINGQPITATFGLPSILFNKIYKTVKNANRKNPIQEGSLPNIFYFVNTLIIYPLLSI